MRPLRSCSTLAVVALLALGCSDKDPVRAPSAVRAGFDGATTALVVEADDPIARLVVTISDALGSREVELRQEDKGGLLAGELDVAPGSKARVGFRAYDVEGTLLYQGKGTLLTDREITSQQEFALSGVPGTDAASVRIGTYRLALTPTTIVGEPGSEARIEAMLLDARGTPHPLDKGGLVWMPTGPQKELGNAYFDYRDYLIDILWIPEKWYTGRMRFCTFDERFCGKLTVQDPNPVVQVATGAMHSCALRKSGVVKCWGDNSVKQLGVDAAGTSWIAGIVFKSISTSANHSCGVDEDDSARCWGSNVSGQLSITTPTSSDYPVIVNGLPDKVKVVTAGGAHSCALLMNGETWCWGLGAYGQLGDGSAIGATPVNNSSVPVKVANAPAFTTISAGYDHTCGLTAAGAAWCWGGNTYGESGIAPTVSDQCDKHPVGNTMWWANCATTARQVQTTVTFAGIGAGSHSTCAWTAAGAGYCWGRAHGNFTSAGYGITHVPVTPTTQPSWKFFTAAGQFQCGIDAIAMIQCFGETSHGQTGTGTTVATTTTLVSPTPVTVQDAWTSVDGGLQHACGVRGGGYVVACWGSNSNGQLGSVTPSGLSATPVSVTQKY